MCVIAGYFTRNLKENLSSSLEDAPNAIMHRRPDLSGSYLNNHAGIGLAHTRLAIKDLSPRNVSNRGFFEPQAVQRLINDNASGRIDASYSLFSLACLEMWCKNFLDKPVAQNSSQ